MPDIYGPDWNTKDGKIEIILSISAGVFMVLAMLTFMMLVSDISHYRQTAWPNF